MKRYIDQTAEDKEAIAASNLLQSHSNQGTSIVDDQRPAAVAQRKLQAAADHYVHQMLPVQRKKNQTGLPDQLKSGIENLSGLVMDDVKVHYNSAKPAQLQAHAYAQGTSIHVAPGQEKHLAHEAWHVVQQKQGRVKPTTQLKGDVKVNNDTALERKADVMGAESLKYMLSTNNLVKKIPPQNEVVQGQFIDFNPNEVAHFANYKAKMEALAPNQQEVFTKLFNDPVISIGIQDAFERAQNINFTKQLNPTNVNVKPRLEPGNIAFLSRINDPEQFIALYAILSAQDDLNWPKSYHEASDELQLYAASLEEDRQQLALDIANNGRDDQQTKAFAGEIEQMNNQLSLINGGLVANHEEATVQTQALMKNFNDPDLFGQTFANEHKIREITIRIKAILTHLRGVESRSHSAKARAHAVEGELVEHEDGAVLYGAIQINGSKPAKNFKPNDTTLQPPVAKSVINLGDRNVKMSKMGSLNGADIEEKKTQIVTAVNRLPTAVSKRQIYTGPPRYADRGPGQANSMAGVNAATYAWALNLPHALTTDWEWLHIQGAGLGGQTNSTNLLPGLYDANTLMIPFESNIKILARYATNFMPLTVDYNVVGPRAGEHVAQSIQLNWQFNHLRLQQGGSATFDILNGRVVTKGDIEVIEEFLKNQRASLIEDQSVPSPVAHSSTDHQAGGGLASESSLKKRKSVDETINNGSGKAAAVAVDEEVLAAVDDTDQLRQPVKDGAV